MAAFQVINDELNAIGRMVNDGVDLAIVCGRLEEVIAHAIDEGLLSPHIAHVRLLIEHYEDAASYIGVIRDAIYNNAMLLTLVTTATSMIDAVSMRDFDVAQQLHRATEIGRAAISPRHPHEPENALAILEAVIATAQTVIE